MYAIQVLGFLLYKNYFLLSTSINLYAHKQTQYIVYKSIKNGSLVNICSINESNMKNSNTAINGDNILPATEQVQYTLLQTIHLCTLQ